MEYITKHEGYQYVGLGFATIFLSPQVFTSYNKKEMDCLSTATLWCICISSFLWMLYMWENSEIIYSIATLYVLLNAIILLMMKLYYYQCKVNEHFKSFGKNPPQISILTTSSENSEPNVV